MAKLFSEFSLLRVLKTYKLVLWKKFFQPLIYQLPDDFCKTLMRWNRKIERAFWNIFKWFIFTSNTTKHKLNSYLLSQFIKTYSKKEVHYICFYRTYIPNSRRTCCVMANVFNNLLIVEPTSIFPDLKSPKNTVELSVFFALLGSLCIKALRKMFVKSTRECMVNFLRIILQIFVTSGLKSLDFWVLKKILKQIYLNVGVKYRKIVKYPFYIDNYFIKAFQIYDNFINLS